MPFKKGNSYGKRFGKDKDAKEAASVSVKTRKQMPELKEMLAKILSQENANGDNIAELILAQISKKAAGGDVKAAEFIFDRAYHKPTQEIKNTGEMPLTIKVVRDAGNSLEA
jgi:hypothetical protein